MKEKRFTYHYVIIIACFIMTAATVGITVNTFTIISPAMIEDLGITATQAQLISLVSTLANMVAGLFVGKLMARFGMRKTMTVGTILMCGGFALRGAASTMLTLCASNFVCGLGMAEISTIPSGVLVNNWFSMEKKGTMSGTVYNTVLVIATTAFAVASGNAVMAVCFGVIFGLLGSMTTVTPPYLTALIVGRKSYAGIFGVVNMFFNIGVAVGAVVAARVFDVTGSFNGAWIAFAVLMVIAAFTTVLSTRRAREYRSMTE